MARRNRKTQIDENIVQEVGQTNENEINQNLDEFIDELNEEFGNEREIKEEITETVETPEETPEEVPQEVIQPKKERTINDLSSVELRMYRRTGIFPK